MANYYVQFSEVIEELTDAEIDWMKECFNYEPPEELPEGYTYPNWYDEDAAFLGFDHELSLEQRAVVLYAEEYGNIDTLEAFVREFIAKFRPDYVFSIGWAETCDKMRRGSFGGGAMIITKDKVEWVSAQQFIRDTRERLAAERSS